MKNKNNCQKIIRTLLIIPSIFSIIIFGLIFPTWPSMRKLCHNLESHILFEECIKIKSRVELINIVFPEGKTTLKEIRDAIGEYLVEETDTLYGSREVYYLSRQPIDYIFEYYDYYSFRFNSSGILVDFYYDDW